MTQHFTSIEQSPYLSRLAFAARKHPDAPALISKQRGRWIYWSWRDALHEIEALAGGLRHLGLRAGRSVVVDGEIRGNSFLTGAAIKTLGARIVSVPLAASGSDLTRTLSDPTIDLIIAQGRDALAEWDDAASHVRRVPIIFDHATPDSRSPEDGILTFDALKRLAKRQNPVAAIPGRRQHLKPEITWFEETTDWSGGLDLLLEHWVSTGTTIALPELLVAASRDRFELRPRKWIASSERVRVNELHIQDRLAPEGSWGRWLAEKVLRGGRAPWDAIVRWRIRRRLGLDRLQEIDVHVVSDDEVRPETQRVFSNLGARLHITQFAGLRAAAE